MHESIAEFTCTIQNLSLCIPLVEVNKKKNAKFGWICESELCSIQPIKDGKHNSWNALTDPTCNGGLPSVQAINGNDPIVEQDIQDSNEY